MLISPVTVDHHSKQLECLDFILDGIAQGLRLCLCDIILESASPLIQALSVLIKISTEANHQLPQHGLNL